MTYATVADVEVRYGRTLSESEAAQAEAWIADIEAEIDDRIPNLYELMAAGRPTYGTVRRVVCAAIIRKLQNPDGLRTTTVAIDDYSTTKTVDSSNSSGLLGLTGEEWALLLPSAGEAFTISPYGAPDAGRQWLSTDVWSPL